MRNDENKKKEGGEGRGEQTQTNNLNMCYFFKLITREILYLNSIMKLNSQPIQY